ERLACGQINAIACENSSCENHDREDCGGREADHDGPPLSHNRWGKFEPERHFRESPLVWACRKVAARFNATVVRSCAASCCTVRMLFQAACTSLFWPGFSPAVSFLKASPFASFAESGSRLRSPKRSDTALAKASSSAF